MPDVTPRFKEPTRARRKPTAASLKKKATAAHSRYVRARDGRCVRCGNTTGQLQCAHIFSRRYTATRTYEGNAVCLCATCHRFLTENPFEHVLFFTDYLPPGEFQRLKDKAYAGVGLVMGAAFWRAELTRLEGLLERLGQ